MVRLLISLMLILCISNESISDVDSIKKFDCRVYDYNYYYMFEQYPKKVVKLANKVEKLKDKLYLEYKDKNDLLETVNYIVAETKSEKYFTAEHVVSIAIAESSLKSTAYNKNDGGRGLMQVMPKYWKEDFPWYNNGFDKRQSVCAGVSVLRIIKAEKKCNTWESIRRYNGLAPASIAYKLRVQGIYKQLLNV